jgi:hypothetical protein
MIRQCKACAGVAFVGASLALFVCLATLSAADDPAEYIKVKSGDEFKLATLPLADLEAGKVLDVEVKGVLTDGIVAIGAETTGTIIKVGKTTWELDLTADPKFKAAAKELSGKPAVVRGKVQKKPCVEIKFRTILKAANLKAG